MSKREFYICVGVLVLILVAIGPVSYYTYQTNIKSQETILLKEKERTERSKTRWETVDKMMKRLPFVE